MTTCSLPCISSLGTLKASVAHLSHVHVTLFQPYRRIYFLSAAKRNKHCSSSTKPLRPPLHTVQNRCDPSTQCCIQQQCTASMTQQEGVGRWRRLRRKQKATPFCVCLHGWVVVAHMVKHSFTSRRLISGRLFSRNVMDRSTTPNHQHDSSTPLRTYCTT